MKKNIERCINFCEKGCFDASIEEAQKIKPKELNELLKRAKQSDKIHYSLFLLELKKNGIVTKERIREEKFNYLERVQI